jgi:hypothetical protein
VIQYFTTISKRVVASLEWLNHNSRPCVFDTATE